MHSDPIADFLTRIRNGQMAGHKVVEIPASNMKKEITKINILYIEVKVKRLLPIFRSTNNYNDFKQCFKKRSIL